MKTGNTVTSEEKMNTAQEPRSNTPSRQTQSPSRAVTLEDVELVRGLLHHPDDKIVKALEYRGLSRRQAVTLVADLRGDKPMDVPGYITEQAAETTRRDGVKKTAYIGLLILVICWVVSHHTDSEHVRLIARTGYLIGLAVLLESSRLLRPGRSRKG